jgi:hypothetical protein
VSRTWTVTGSTPADTTPPDTSITAGPLGSVPATTATFSFASTEANSTFACQLDTTAFAPCTSPKTYTGLSVGSHAFRVQATDPAGNTDASTASRGWTVTAPEPTESFTLPLYRLYSSATGHHFYTTSASDRDFAVQKAGYKYENVVGYLSSVDTATTTPLYRLYSPYSGHFYTTSAVERDFAVQQAGYRYENIVGYIAATTTSAAPNALYRLYSPIGGRHFYTTSASDRDFAVQKAGYKYEGVSAYLPLTAR